MLRLLQQLGVSGLWGEGMKINFTKPGRTVSGDLMKENEMTTKCTDNLTLGEIKELMQIFGKTPDTHQPFEVGKAYLIRTVTFYYTGRVKSVGDKEIVLSDVAWIADTDRFNDALKSGNFKEVEPFLHDVIIGRGAIIDATIWDKELPRSQI